MNMRPLRYSINVTLDGCVDHRAGTASEALHRHHAANLAAADGFVCGRVTYEMMDTAWREPARTGVLPDWMEPWMLPFARGAAAFEAVSREAVSMTKNGLIWLAAMLGIVAGATSVEPVRAAGRLAACVVEDLPE